MLATLNTAGIETWVARTRWSWTTVAKIVLVLFRQTRGCESTRRDPRSTKSLNRNTSATLLNTATYSQLDFTVPHGEELALCKFTNDQCVSWHRLSEIVVTQPRPISLLIVTQTLWFSIGSWHTKTPLRLFTRVTLVLKSALRSYRVDSHPETPRKAGLRMLSSYLNSGS